VHEGQGEIKGNTYPIDVVLQLLHKFVRDGGLPVDEKTVENPASADEPGLCGRALDGDEGLSLYGGGNHLSVRVVAYRPVNILHNNKPNVARLEGEVDIRGPYNGVGLVVEDLSDEVLRPGFTHGDGPAELNPSIGVGLVDERDAAIVGVRACASLAAVLDNHVGARQVGGLVVGVNEYLDLRHDGY